MVLPAGVQQSITKNNIDISTGWMFASFPIWSLDYSAPLAQPVSMAEVPLTDLRFLDPTVTLVIRQSASPTSLVLWSGVAVMDDDTGGGSEPEHNDLPGRSEGDAHPMTAISGFATAQQGGLGRSFNQIFGTLRGSTLGGVAGVVDGKTLTEDSGVVSLDTLAQGAPYREAASGTTYLLTGEPNHGFEWVIYGTTTTGFNIDATVYPNAVLNGIRIDGETVNIKGQAYITYQFGTWFIMAGYSAASLPGGPYQPLDSDLTAIAALATTPFGRSLLTQVDAAATRSAIGAQPAGSYQPLEDQLLSTYRDVRFSRVKVTADGYQAGVAPLTLENNGPVIAFKCGVASLNKKRWNVGFSGNEFGLWQYADNEDWIRRSWTVFPNSDTGRLEFSLGDGETDILIPMTGSALLKFVAYDASGGRLAPAVAGVDYALPGGGSGTLVLGESYNTAYRGDRGAVAYDHSQSYGNPHFTSAADVGAQPLDSDLTAIAALATTPYGRALLTLADAAAARVAVGLSPTDSPEFANPVVTRLVRRIGPGTSSVVVDVDGTVNAVNQTVYGDQEVLGAARFAALSGGGGVVADSSGHLTLVPLPAAPLWPNVLWVDNAKTVALASGGWGSLLSASLAKRTIPANTWTPGMSLEFEIEGVKQANGISTYLGFFIGPAGTYTTPYYIPVSAGLDTGLQRFRTKVRLVCLTTGVAGTFAASFETLDGLGDEFAYVGRNATGYLDTIDTTVDRVIDFAAQTPFDVVGVYSKCVMTIPGAGEGRPSAPVVGGTPPLALEVGTDGDMVYTHPTGQKIFNGNHLYSWTYQGGGDYSNLTVDSTTETTIIDETDAGRNGLFPVLSPGYLLGQGPIWVRVRGGHGVIGANPVLTVRVYLGATVVGTKRIDLSTFTRTTENMGFELLFWIEPINAISPGTSLRLRAHHYGQVSQGLADAAGSFLLSEDETYSNIDGTAAQNLKVTAQWSGLGSQTWAFFDGIEVYR